MNKHIINSLSEYNYTFDKNYGYGFIYGYEANVYNNPMATGQIFMFSTLFKQIFRLLKFSFSLFRNVKDCAILELLT